MYNLSIDLLFYSFLISLTFGYLILKTRFLHSIITNDTRKGPQKVHDHDVIRVGGVAIFLSLFIFCFFKPMLWPVFFSSIPVFLAGFLEDVTKKISPNWRLLATFFSAYLISSYANYQISSLGFSYLNNFLSFSVISILITSLSIVMLTQSFNLIDGLNGLVSFTSIIILLACILLGYKYEDFEFISICLVFIGIILGFLVFNFPYGKIFLGDGGAYFLGILISTVIISLPLKFPSISPFTSLMLILYPIHEVIRSFLRRALSKTKNTMKPDDGHLHSIIFLLVSNYFKKRSYRENSLSTIITLTVPIITTFFAIKYHDNQNTLILLILSILLVLELMFLFFNRKLSTK